MNKGLDDAITRKRSKSTTEKDDNGDIESGKKERKNTVTAKSSKSSESKTSTKKDAPTPSPSKESSVGQVDNMVYIFVARDNEMTVYSQHVDKKVTEAKFSSDIYELLETY